MTSPHAIEAEYDLVFAGGGTVACVCASRLATAFPDLKILVLECGPTTKDNKQHIRPGQFFTHLASTSPTVKYFVSKPSVYLAGRSLAIPTGRCIGGSSSINAVVYNHPAASDFDDWENEFSNPGWSSKELIPLLQKVETYEIDPKKPRHGSDGPLKVSYGGQILDLAKQFVELGPKFEKDRPLTDDGNEFGTASINAFHHDCRSTQHHYIYNKDWKNLSVLDGCRVQRVVFEDGIATGVEYLFDKQVYPSAPQDIRIVKARRIVVVSAGTMSTPLVLERSGIGKKDVLEKAGIPVIAEVPGVGENFQDHPNSVAPYFADPNTPTFDPLFRGEPETWCKMTEQWEKDGTGLLATNGVDAQIKIRPHPEELAELGPDFAKYWKDVFANKPDKPLFWLCTFGGLAGDQSALPPGKYMCTGCFMGIPASRGYVHISSSDPYADPDFYSGYLSNPVDILALRWGYKKGRELIRRIPAFRGALIPGHPQFAEGSPAALTETGPVPLDAPKVVYSAEDDKAIDESLRKFVTTAWHPLGTCAMKPFEMGGVVDSKLNVYGVKNLKVADLSIPPSNVNANTYSTGLAIGEKAAVIIAAELGGRL
ncbi:GMC oxidoreductase-domain-containing protein [Mycena rosella]|uniref:GMC oxidoreductase-domain-containing protein n=1 Tax=Mycena rosella TaxID=1033263 RepID=A0AAD7GE17_MYCRO|nr:GMC oxidoreductase-domain-containing protein [Mycena rosella]